MKLIEKKDVNTNTKVRLCQTVEIGRSGRTRSRFVNDFVNNFGKIGRSGETGHFVKITIKKAVVLFWDSFKFLADNTINWMEKRTWS